MTAITAQQHGVHLGLEQVDVGKAQSEDFGPSLYHYVSHLHIAVSGFIAATGIAVFVLVWFGVRRGLLWAWVGAVAAPAVGLAVALPAHYPWAWTRSATSADLPRDRHLRRGRAAGAQAAARAARAATLGISSARGPRGASEA